MFRVTLRMERMRPAWFALDLVFEKNVSNIFLIDVAILIQL